MLPIKAVVFIFCFIALVSCSGGNPVLPEAANLKQAPVQTGNGAVQSDNSHLWGIWQGYISGDGSVVDLYPSRTSDFALNVVGFLEQAPCTDCLKVLHKTKIGPNRLDVTIQMKHPFPGHKEFTGFDVYGGIDFPATRIVTQEPPGTANEGYIGTSWRGDGGAQLLNADEYDDINNWLNIGYKWKWQAFIPGKLGGEFVGELLKSPGCNEYGYRILASNPARNMFECNATVLSTYQLWIPDGGTKFGYIVNAHWDAPTKTPVVNPVTDFPPSANDSAHPIPKIEILEVKGPITPTQFGHIIFKATWSEFGPYSLPPIGEFQDGNSFFWNTMNGPFWDGNADLAGYVLLAADENSVTFDMYLQRHSGWNVNPPGHYPFLLGFHFGGGPGLQLTEIDTED